jgi:protein subunit release factor B
MERELLFSLTKKDFKVEYFRAGGKGGQHANKTSTACRIKHLASGAVAECRETRSQQDNKGRAFRRLVNSDAFKKWHKVESSRAMGLIKSSKEIKSQIERELADPKITRVEYL